MTGDVLGEIRRHPFGSVRSSRDDQLLLVFGKQGAVEEVHGGVLSLDELRDAERAQYGRSPLMPARSIFRWHGG